MFDLPFFKMIAESPVMPLVCLGFLLVASFICWWMYCNRLVKESKRKGDHDDV